MNTKKIVVKTVPAIQIVELGTATTLTLGGGGGGAETRNRPFGILSIQLGNASELTRGGRGNYNEYMRPNAQYTR